MGFEKKLFFQLDILFPQDYPIVKQKSCQRQTESQFCFKHFLKQPVFILNQSIQLLIAIDLTNFARSEIFFQNQTF